MRTKAMHRGSPGRGWAAPAVCLLLVFSGCQMDEVNVPGFDGPAEFSLALRLTAVPDIVTADGFSTSVIQAVLRDQNARPIAGRAIFFAVSDSAGRFADIGFFQTSNGPGTGATVVTNSQGLAQIVYQAPARTDVTANTSVLVSARQVGNDFAGQIYKTVRIELRSAEPRLFPPGAGGSAPVCGIVVETPSGQCSSTAPPTPTPAPTPTPSPAPSPTPTPSPPPEGFCSVKVNTTVLFQTRSFDPDGTIVRYEWFFGDGTPVVYAPDTNHVYRITGTFSVFHRVTDNGGNQSNCSAAITVIP